jgi:hypothetical protein
MDQPCPDLLMIWFTSSHYCPDPHGGEIVCTFGIAISVDGLRRQPETKLSSRQLDVLRLLVQAKSTVISQTSCTWRRTPCAIT